MAPVQRPPRRSLSVVMVALVAVMGCLCWTLHVLMHFSFNIPPEMTTESALSFLENDIDNNSHDHSLLTDIVQVPSSGKDTVRHGPPPLLMSQSMLETTTTTDGHVDSDSHNPPPDRSLEEHDVLTVLDEPSSTSETTLTTSTTRSASTTNTHTNTPITVAYVISIIKCGDHQTNAPGMLDAAAVLRHSIHTTSIRTPSSGSKYDYRMIAMVHRQAESCSREALTQLGYTVLVRDAPVAIHDIRGDYLRQHIHRAWCCGADEFIKLYAYTLVNETIVVSLDVDMIVTRPMDDVYDVLLWQSSSNITVNSDDLTAAQHRIPLERPTDPWPPVVDAFMTRDWPQVKPGRHIPLFQAGFLVIRPSLEDFDRIVAIVKEGNYVEGLQNNNGWGGMGYGGLVGASTYTCVFLYLGTLYIHCELHFPH
jgi:hypothetical protein